MKRVQEIISYSLAKKSLFKKKATNTLILKNLELQKLLVFLPNSIKKSVVFIRYERTRLLFAFKNQAVLHEMKNYSNIYKEHILEFKQKYGEFDFLDSNFKIDCYIPLNLLKQFQRRETGIFEEVYTERADRNFVNLATNKEIFQAFEHLRNVLTC